MKLAMLLLTVGALQVSAGGFSQSVTLTERNARLESVFQKIEQQTGFYFWYENKNLRGAKKVNLNLIQVPLREALDQCLANQSLTYVIIDKTIVIKDKRDVKENDEEQAPLEIPATVEISGVVVDESGNPLSGASVNLKGRRLGTSTDNDGHFSIQAPGPSGTLVISYVGMTAQEVRFDGQKPLRIVMVRSNTEQKEIVIIGYGVQKKKEVTGAVSSVKVGEISQDVSGNVSSALQGRVAGVTIESNSGAPGAGLSITIRGSSTIGSNTPLYVVDGVFLGNIDFINPSDVESIDVLKDASAASIYGSRAANGVIIITTKSGKKNSGPRVQASAVSGVQSIPKHISVLNGQQWTNLFKANVSGIPDYNGVSTNWQDVVFRTASMSKMNVNVSGGTNNFVYNISGGYLQQDGTIRATDYSAANFRAKTQFEKGRVKIGETVMINSSKGRQLPSGGDQPGIKNGLLVMLPTVPVYDTANKLGGWGRRASYMKNLSNPLANLMSKDFENNGTTLLAEAFFEVRLIDQLKYKLNVGLTNAWNYSNQYITAYDDGNNAVSQAQLNQSTGFSNSWLLENTLSYDKKIGLHNISLVAGYTTQKDSANGFNAAGTGIPQYVYTLNGATANQTVGGSASSTRRISMLGRVTYSYDARYLLSASIRRDGSSMFAAGHQYGVYPAVSAGWNLSNEEFFRNAINPTIISSLKIRGGWGKQGNDLIGNYTTQSTITSNINYIQGGSLWQGAIPNGNASPKDLKWEETKSIDAGIDASFFNNKLGLVVDVFKRTTSGVLLSVPVPISLGITGSPVVNAGVVENKGIELTLNYADHAGKLNYDIGFNLSTLNNKMTAITIGSGNQQFGDITRAQVGYPLGGFWLIKTNGIFQSDAEAAAYTDKNGNRIQPNAMGGDIRFVDYDGSGTINNGDRQYMGSPFPKLVSGLSGYFTWMDFDLNILFQGTFGNKIYNSSRIWLEKMTEVTNLSTATLNAWTPTNHSNFPRFILADPNQNAQIYTDRWLEDGSYIRLKRLELGYVILKSLSRKMNIERIRVNASAENLFTITKYKGFNPDIGNGGDPLSRGIDEGRFITGSLYPLQRTILFGLNISF